MYEVHITRQLKSVLHSAPSPKKRCDGRDLGLDADSN